MLNRLLRTGLVAGLMVGVLVTLLHLTVVTPIILQAEVYEEAAEQHAAVAAAAPGTLKSEPAAHTHDAATPAHEHEDEGWQPSNGLERSFYTTVANLVAAVGYALVLAAGFTIYGGTVSPLSGALWGFAGFLSFWLLPGLGLPPELPGAAAAELMSRQIWWIATAAASIAGLALIVFGGTWLRRGGGIILLLLPHLIGAPETPEGQAGAVPPELAAHFVMATMFLNLVLWVALGVAAAWLFERFRPAPRGSAVDISV